MFHGQLDNRIRQQAGGLLQQLVTGRPVGFHPHRVTCSIGSASGGLDQPLRGVLVKVHGFDAVAPGHRPALGHGVHCNHPVAPKGADARGQPAHGPEAEDRQASVPGHIRVGNSLPCSGQDDGEDEVAVVRQSGSSLPTTIAP